MDEFEHAQAGKHLAPPPDGQHHQQVEQLLAVEEAPPRDPDGHFGAGRE